MASRCDIEVCRLLILLVLQLVQDGAKVTQEVVYILYAAAGTVKDSIASFQH